MEEWFQIADPFKKKGFCYYIPISAKRIKVKTHVHTLASHYHDDDTNTELELKKGNYDCYAKTSTTTTRSCIKKINPFLSLLPTAPQINSRLLRSNTCVRLTLYINILSTLHLFHWPGDLRLWTQWHHRTYPNSEINKSSCSCLESFTLKVGVKSKVEIDWEVIILKLKQCTNNHLYEVMHWVEV